MDSELLTPLDGTMDCPSSLEQKRYEPFHSILFDSDPAQLDMDTVDEPEFFKDLNLDQVIDAVTRGREEYNLKPFFFMPLHRVDSIYYRQDIHRDLEEEALSSCIRSFSKDMQSMRRLLAHSRKCHYPLQSQRLFLNAVHIYCDAVRRLRTELQSMELHSRGMLAFREYLNTYSRSSGFISLLSDTAELQTDLSRVRYSLTIKGRRVDVGHYSSEPDYGEEVSKTFGKFENEATSELHFEFPSSPELNHVEAAILDRVARLNPELFSRLESYYNRNREYLDKIVSRFDREVQFYLSYMDYVAALKRSGLPFCYPVISTGGGPLYGRDLFDVALAQRLVAEGSPVVCNDFELTPPERIFVVSGPNQGGKTTFARTFGQVHYLASISCPVPGTQGCLHLYDRLFTHFERQEDIRNLRGKLEDELIRINKILSEATPDSILIMNESFLSTTLEDALFLSKQIMREVIRRGILCVSVTFLDEIASMGEATVSMVSMVDPQDPAIRTFKIMRRPAGGMAYAAAIAEKYRLTYNDIGLRIAHNTQRSAAS